jgi:uncharacterized protein YecE (DUF72 family)
LACYAASFSTVELNSSFYRWPRPAAFASWRQRLPDGFAMSVKAPRGLTHARKVTEPEAWIERIAAGWHELGDRRAVLLPKYSPTSTTTATPMPSATPGLSRLCSASSREAVRPETTAHSSAS